VSHFKETWTLWTDLKKNHQISNVNKILSLGDELLHEDGRTANKYMRKSLFAVVRTLLAISVQMRIEHDDEIFHRESMVYIT